jgi:hypothetical protein
VAAEGERIALIVHQHRWIELGVQYGGTEYGGLPVCTVSLLWDSMFDVQPGGVSSYFP